MNENESDRNTQMDGYQAFLQRPISLNQTRLPV